MKLKNLFLLISVSFSTLMFAQTKEVVVDSKEYHEIKQAGKLHEYNLVYDINSFEPIESKKTKKPKPSDGKPKTGNCDCYQEPDASYILAMAPNDDFSSGLITIPFNFNFYGVNYTQMYINNNGNVTFVNPLATYSSDAFPSTPNKIVAPFWADVDTRAGNGEVLYLITPTAIFVNWEEVGYFNQHGDLLNTFQLIISDGTDPAIPDGNNVAFCYQDMQWTTGDASEGQGGFPMPGTDTYATCGTNKGDGISSFQLAQFGHEGTDFDGSMGNDDGVSWLDGKSFYINVNNSVNIPPIAEGVAACDTFKVCSYGDTADISINFFAPEAGQTTTISYTNGGLASLIELANNPGNTAQLVLRIIGSAADAGTYDLTVTATDDFLPVPGVTTMNFVIQIIDDSTFAIDPTIQFTTACDSIEVSVTNGPYDTYLWDNLDPYATTYVQESGNFGVTVSSDQCYKRIDTLIFVPEPVPFDLVGNLYLCPGEDSTFVQVGDSLLMATIDWNLSDPSLNSQFHNWLYPGTYTLNNTDLTGLCANDTTFSIFMATSATLFGDVASCFGLNYQSTGVVLGTDSQWSSPDPEISFSNPNVANPVITASTYGTYTVNLTTPCEAPLTAQITYPFAPTIFADDTICGNEFTIPLNEINTFGPSTWTLVNPLSGTFSPNNSENATTFTATSTPYQFIMILSDNLCPNLNDQAQVLMVASPTMSAPDLSCDLGEFDLTSTSYQGGVWSILDNPTTPFLEDTAADFLGTQNSANPDILVSQAGLYTIQFTDNFCNETFTEVLNFPPYIWTEIKDTNLCFGIEYPLDAWQGPSPVSYTWSTGVTDWPTILVTEPGVYTVTITNECYTYSDNATITYYLCDIIAPNVISLNSTSGNNIWFVEADGIAEFNCTIVNRWGNLIYEFSDVNGYWDGRDKSGNQVEDGVYFYRIDAKIFGGDKLEKHGNITVVR